MIPNVLKIPKAAVMTTVDDARERFIKVYRDFSGLVRRILFRMLGASSLDDALQEVFLRVWKGLGTFDGRASIKTWVSRVTVYLASDMLKKRRRDPGDTSFLPDDAIVLEYPEDTEGEDEAFGEEWLALAEGLK